MDKKPAVESSYGEEVILDLHECDPATFTRATIKAFLFDLCGQLQMERCELHFWDDVGVPEDERQTEPHLKGTSAVQFIMTSSVVIHTLDLLGKVFVNVFSCGEVDEKIVRDIIVKHFRGKVVNSTKVVRS